MSFDNNKKEKEFSTEEAFKGEAANAAKALQIKNE